MCILRGQVGVWEGEWVQVSNYNVVIRYLYPFPFPHPHLTTKYTHLPPTTPTIPFYGSIFCVLLRYYAIFCVLLRYYEYAIFCVLLRYYEYAIFCVLPCYYTTFSVLLRY